MFLKKLINIIPFFRNYFNFLLRGLRALRGKKYFLCKSTFKLLIISLNEHKNETTEDTEITEFWQIKLYIIILLFSVFSVNSVVPKHYKINLKNLLFNFVYNIINCKTEMFANFSCWSGFSKTIY